MHKLVFEVVEKAALEAGLPQGRVMAQVNKDNLTLERPRIELAFLPEGYRRTGRTLAWERKFAPPGMAAAAQRSEPDFTSGEATPSVAQDARPRGMQIRKRELYEADLTVYANVLSEDEDWLSDFSHAFVAALPKGVNDKHGNWVGIRVEKATFSRPPDKRVGDTVIEVFKKADKLFELKFTFRITKDEKHDLIPDFNILPKTGA